MAATERLALVVTANGAQAVSELNRVGGTARTQLGQAERSLDAVSSKMMTMGAASVAGGALVARGIYQAVQSTQDLADSVDKADAVFGSASNLDAYAANAADNLGLSKAAALDAASAYGLLLQQSGVGGEALARASTELATRTADIAEQYKKPYEEVQKAIENVIKTGSSRALRSLLGVNINIDPEALKGLDVATRTTKIYDEILRQTAGSAGFFSQSTDDMGVQLQRAQARWENAKASFGEASLPGLTNLLETGSAVLDLFEQLPGPMKEVLATIVSLGAATAIVGGGISVVGGGLLKAVPGARAAATAFREAGGGMAGVTGALGAFSPAAIGATAAIGAGLGIYEAWASSAARVDQEIATLTDSLTTITDKAQTLPLLAQQFNQILDTREGGSDAFAKTGLAITDVVNAVNAAPGSLDKFRDSVDGAFGSLENLDGGIGSLIDIGGGIDGVRASAEKAPAPVRALLNNLIELYESGQLSAGELRAVIDYMTDLDRAAKGSADGVRFQAEQLFKIVPAAQQGAEAMRLYQIATDRTAGVDAQADALRQLKALFPEAAASAGLMAAALGQVDTAADATAQTIKDTASAADSLKSANDRVTAAQKRLADATKRDGKAIEDAYERVVAAKERLDDILAGDGNNLEQESPQAQEARARAKLQEASLRLAANPNDALAQADKAEALQSISDAQQRGQELLRNAQDIARQTRDAQRDLEDAQETYNETLVGNPEEVQAAREELATAERDRAQLLGELGIAFQEGKISVEAYKAELDRQVAAGIISPESAAILKGQVDSLATQVGLAGAALGALPGVVDQIKQSIAQREGVPSYQTTPGAYSNAQSAIGRAASDAIARGIAQSGVATRSPLSAAEGRRVGLGDDPLELNGQVVTDRQGRRWAWNGRQWAPRADGGPMVAGQGYLVGERGPELIVPSQSGYVLNADRTKAITGGGATTWNVTNNIKATEPKRAAAETVRKMKARKFMMAGS